MFAIPEYTVPPLSHRPLSPTALVRSVTADPPRWRDVLAGASTAPALVPYDDPRVEIWLSAWPALYRGPSRRYDAPQGAFAVLSGQIVENSGDRSRILRPGQVRVFGPGYRHSVLNVGAEPAVTVHVQIRAQPG